ncbi:hypothetical protein RSOL_430560 [Rhizoctonia solani AG-3 Rhs1AP]|nr:hypothetical protein RSOL_430560 [Rhizoctonia solani AG-3 Rhs1AP]
MIHLPLSNKRPETLFQLSPRRTSLAIPRVRPLHGCSSVCANASTRVSSLAIATPMSSTQLYAISSRSSSHSAPSTLTTSKLVQIWPSWWPPLIIHPRQFYSLRSWTGCTKLPRTFVLKRE